jgi:hypothetical protein
MTFVHRSTCFLLYVLQVEGSVEGDNESHVHDGGQYHSVPHLKQNKIPKFILQSLSNNVRNHIQLLMSNCSTVQMYTVQYTMITFRNLP